MKCPNCGFENMPGLTRCTVCERELSVGPARERLRPIRARDRSIWERVRFAARRQLPTIRLYLTRTAESGRTGRFSSPLFVMGPGDYLMALLAVVPGLGHMCVLGRRKTGVCMLLASVMLLSAGGILYKHSISDALFCLVILLSAYSVWCVVREFFRDRGIRMLADIGVALMVTSMYLGTYAIARIVLRPVGQVMTLVATPMTPEVVLADSVLVVPLREIKRGVLVVTTWQDEGTGLGPILGMPGDTVSLADDRVYVNGTPTNIVRHLGAGPNAGSTQVVRLTTNEIWIPPTLETGGNDIQRWLTLGVVERQNILGRVSAVVAPATHRHTIE